MREGFVPAKCKVRRETDLLIHACVWGHKGSLIKWGSKGLIGAARGRVSLRCPA
jgi:hypothetical protein